MASDSDQVNDVAVNPYQEVIAFNVALHTVFVISFEHVRLIFCRDWQIVDKQVGYLFKSCHLFRIFGNPFEVFFELACRV